MTANLRESTKATPLLSRKRSLGEDVGDLIFGINILDVHARVLAYAFPQPAEIDSVSAGHVPHSQRSALDTLLDDSVIILKNNAFA